MLCPIFTAIQIATELVSRGKAERLVTAEKCFTWCISRVKFDPTGEICTQVCNTLVKYFVISLIYCISKIFNSVINKQNDIDFLFKLLWTDKIIIQRNVFSFSKIV